MWAFFYLWEVEHREAKGWLRGRNPSLKPQLERLSKDESEMYVYVIPGDPWSMLTVYAHVLWAAVLGHLVVVQVPVRECLFYFPCCLTDSIQSADRCVTISSASLGDVFGLCVYVLGGWKVFDPSYLLHPGVFVFTGKAQPQCWCHVTQGGMFHKNHTQIKTTVGNLPSTHPPNAWNTS